MQNDDSAHNPGLRQNDRAQKVEYSTFAGGAALSAGPGQMYRGVLTPKEVWAAFVNTGEAKGNQTVIKTFVLGVAAGCYLGLGKVIAF